MHNEVLIRTSSILASLIHNTCPYLNIQISWVSHIFPDRNIAGNRVIFLNYQMLIKVEHRLLPMGILCEGTSIQPLQYMTVRKETLKPANKPV